MCAFSFFILQSILKTGAVICCSALYLLALVIESLLLILRTENLEIRSSVDNFRTFNSYLEKSKQYEDWGCDRLWYLRGVGAKTL